MEKNNSNGNYLPKALKQVTILITVKVEDKLHWTSRLYDVDGSGEIDPEEMEQAEAKLRYEINSKINKY